MAAPATDTSGMEYDVFLSFHGPDTRDTFTSCLYEFMAERGIRVFKDDAELRVGQKIGGQLFRALEDTQIYIPIFSKDFASSWWCLREVAHMVDCTSKSDGKKQILPVFFGVGPNDLKLKTGLYRDALSEHLKKFGPGLVKRWGDALAEVPTRVGWKLQGQGYGELIRSIIREVQLKLKVEHQSLPDHLVKVDDQEAIEELLDAGSDGVRLVILHGTGGIGKSTLAKVITDHPRSPIRTRSRAKMADQTELSDRVTNMEEQMKQFLTAMQEMTAEFRAARLNSFSASAPKQKDNNNFVVEFEEEMPPLDDDPITTHEGRINADDVPKTEHEKRLEKLEEKLKQLQGHQEPSSTDLSVYSRVKMPKKFKMPEFEKYDGTTCPRAHLQIYLVRMTQYVDNTPLMVQSFQASLTGPALRWYITKSINLLETWDEVCEAFLKQYKFITDIALSRDDLERAEKKRNESFKEYAIRWRNLAAQVDPEPIDMELRKMFIKTLPYEYRTRMIATTADSFNQLIPMGEQIEIGLRDGWFNEPTRRFTTTKEREPEAEVNMTDSRPGANRQFSGRQRNARRQFTSLHAPLSKVLPILQKKGLLYNEPKRPNPERYSIHDPSKKCDYHMGEVGHSTDDCIVLKHKVQDLLDTKTFSFSTGQPNVKRNPPPNHVGNAEEVTE